MRDSFFTKLQYIRFALLYYMKYFSFVSTLERSVYVSCSVLSCGSIAGWFVWDKVPFIWATLIVCSQAISVAWPLLPFSNRRAGLSMIIPKLHELADNVEYEWDKHCNEDFDYTELHRLYSKQLTKLTVDCLGPEEIPSVRFLQKKADVEFEQYMQRRFDIGSEST